MFHRFPDLFLHVLASIVASLTRLFAKQAGDLSFIPKRFDSNSAKSVFVPCLADAMTNLEFAVG